MKKLILAALLLSTAASHALECEATKLYNNGRTWVTVEADLKPVSPLFPGKLQADLEDGYFTIAKYDDNKYVAKIVLAPNYNDSVSTTADFTSQNTLNISKVLPEATYTLNCTK